MSEVPSLVTRERAFTEGRWVLRRADSAVGHCPKFPFDYLNLATGEVRPASCKSIRCGVCGAFEVKRRAWRAANVGPSKFLTLTLLADDLPTALAQERRFLRKVRDAYGEDVEWCRAHERTKSGLRHSHALVRADAFLPQRALSVMAEASGMGRVVWISEIRQRRGAAGYAFKEALKVVGYATKGAESLSEHLALNGGRLYLASRGYFREAA